MLWKVNIQHMDLVTKVIHGYQSVYVSLFLKELILTWPIQSCQYSNPLALVHGAPCYRKTHGNPVLITRPSQCRQNGDYPIGDPP